MQCTCGDTVTGAGTATFFFFIKINNSTSGAGEHALTDMPAHTTTAIVLKKMRQIAWRCPSEREKAYPNSNLVSTKT